MKSGTKWFDLIELAWRHITDPKQFTVDEDLFRRAGLINEVTSSLQDRMLAAQCESEARAERMKHVLPPSEPVSIAPPDHSHGVKRSVIVSRQTPQA
ncbi:MAG: hypothetical protein KGI49_02105 [Patescibacteria group bacterium]|nr:hypothetical protein [Patescibacteria group bacterium]